MSIVIEERITTERILQEWNQLKNEISALQKREKVIKEAIHRRMDERNVNRLASRNFVASRNVQTRRTIHKESVDPQVWMDLSTETRFPVLTLKKI